jgi:DNA-binding HxlR family transcriptional regulator
LQGPRRFEDFQESSPGLVPNVLSPRLKSLEENGLVARQLYARDRSHRWPRDDLMAL